ncbi:MAG: hypothetical protein QG640_718 [Patescibacteria group bacterium]|nr:hypothetical protein [Patescibacteria group bacterium]
MELWLIPFGIFFVVHEKGGWKNVFLLFIFLFLFVGGIIFMGVDLFHGITSPFHPHSMFVTAIPWVYILLFIFVISVALALKHIYTKIRSKKATE